MSSLTHLPQKTVSPEDLLKQDGFYVGLAAGVAVTTLLLTRDPQAALGKALKIFVMLEQGLSVWQQFLNDDPGGHDE